MIFDDFFAQATDGRSPYPYQRRLASSEQLVQVLDVPTGIGKTAAVVLGWLYRRRFAGSSVRQSTPRRLVYCLPMRTLVNQTEAECRQWLENLDLSDEVGVHKLRGGEAADDWDQFPEKDAIIVGTQDMLLSRALNRGYAMSRYRWPIHFALLNNDCLWIMDETQLMGVGLTTSVQLAGLRQKLGTFYNTQTLWMSATLDTATLDTVDHHQPDPQVHRLVLDSDDKENESISRLLDAKKPLERSPIKLSKETSKKYENDLATTIVKTHQPKTLTLVVINTVERAQRLFQAIQKLLKPKKKEAGTKPAQLTLIHSRFRAGDRQEIQSNALDETTIPQSGRIIVATQAIEAGVDISATTMFTELAPWASMVQRFGRCNRRGICGQEKQPDAMVVWIDIDTSDGKVSRFTLPYEPDRLDSAREALDSLDNVGLQSLEQMDVMDNPDLVHVLRRKDLIDLFDTTPDLGGKDLDVSRYVRESEDSDLQIYWR